jgi:ABC-type nickel/cobalt efflux system permease component RcnA
MPSLARLRPARLLPLRAALVALAAIAALGAWPQAASAHPLGNFTVNRYSRLEPGAGSIALLYVVDMAEIPTFQERARLDTDGDGAVSAAEHDAYLAAEAAALRANLHLSAAGQPLPLTLRESTLEFPEGQGGLPTTRITARFESQLAAGQESWDVAYRDDNFAGRIGWQEVVARAGAGAELAASDVPGQDQSQELRVYPQDMLQSPPTVSAARISFRVGAGGQGAALPALAAQPEATRAADQFAALIALPVSGPAALLLALLVAFGLGAMHALAPGHGKTVVAAYLVGSRGTALHALFLGITTTITHTIGVFALGLVTLFVSRYILPEQLYPWLGVISGAFVVVIGVALFTGRLGLLHGHSHDHDHNHAAEGMHSHGGFAHTHDVRAQQAAPQQQQRGPLGWGSLLLLGISGGLLPCPSALVVLLSAIALGRVGFGLLLILCFSLGLASVLTAIGVALVHAGRLFERVPLDGRLLRVLPVASALIVTAIGLGITLQALMQTGLL